jgi:hypothetical protein
MTEASSLQPRYIAKPEARVGTNYTLKVGQANPKTFIPPVVPAPIYDFEHWRGDRTYLLPSAINDQKIQIDQSWDGDVVKSCYKIKDDGKSIYDTGASQNLVNKYFRKTIKEPYGEEDDNQPSSLYYTSDSSRRRVESSPGGQIVSQNPIDHKTKIRDYGGLWKRDSFIGNGCKDEGPWVPKELAYAKYQQTGKDQYNVIMNERRNPEKFYFTGDENLNGVDDEYEWNIQNLQKDISLPSNLTFPEIERDPRLGSFNRNLFTQTIQPNIYSRNEVIEPINSNIGISFNPQFQPLDSYVGPVNGNEVTFTRLDPQLVRDDEHPLRKMENPERKRWTNKISQWEAAPGTVRPDQYAPYYDIYDPRFYGYGDGTRSYVDTNLGQVRYYYSDVDAYRRPNFVIRSNVDHMDFQDSMGAVKPEYRRRVLQENLRDLTNDKFIQDSLYHREDLMERQMRKRNQEMWQLRARPVRGGATSSNMMRGPTY